MPNKFAAGEWLELAKRHLGAAELLFREKHYNDIIALELHQCIEKSMKAISAFHNKSVVKTHDLIVLLGIVEEHFTFDRDIKKILEIATDYYVEKRYPQLSVV